MSHHPQILRSEVIQEILQALEALRFGSVEITVHEGRVTQIERREKIRFSSHDPQRNKPTASAAATFTA